MSGVWPDATGWTIIGLGVVTVVARGVFLVPERAVGRPERLERALQVAPLAALFAVLVPEIVLLQGELLTTWRDARLPAVAVATAWYVWRRGTLGPLLAGLAAYLPAKLWLGW